LGKELSTVKYCSLPSLKIFLLTPEFEVPVKVLYWRKFFKNLCHKSYGIFVTIPRPV